MVSLIVMISKSYYDIDRNFRTHPKISQKITKTIRLRELADSSVNITFRVWCKSEEYWDVYYDVMESAKTKFDEEGISIPFPQMDIHMRKVEV